MLTTYDWLLGIAQLAAAFLAIIAAIVAITMFKHARQQKILGAWKWLLIALIIFTVEEIIGALKTFGVYSTPYLTHVVPFFILAFLIAALVKQIEITKGWME